LGAAARAARRACVDPLESLPMALSPKCPACGKTQRLADADAGAPVVCRACGARFQAPGAVAGVGRGPVAANASKRATKDAGANWAVWIVSAAAACALALIVCFTLVLAGDSWEASNRPRILALEAEARRFVLDGRLKEAYEAYERVESLVGQRQIARADLRDVVAEAQLAKAQVYAAILRQLAASPNDAAAAENEPATQPAAPIAAHVEPPEPSTLPAFAPATAPAPPVPAREPVVQAATAPTSQPAFAIRKPLRRVAPGEITDEEIGQSIQRGVDAMIGLFENGALKAGRNNRTTYYMGLDALCVYALLQSGQAIKDERLNPRGPFVRSLLSVLKELPAEGGQVTYARALRASALAFLNRPEDRDALKKDVGWLIKAANRGAYSYDDRMAGVAGTFRGERIAVWDNSNSQYGLLGVWAGAEVGIEVPNHYWTQVENHWHECQTESGEWGYGQVSRKGKGYLAMTVAGAASLLVTHDYLHAPRVGRNKQGLPEPGAGLGQSPFSKLLQRTLDFLETGDNAMNVADSHWGPGYTLYGLERVGLASGMKYFGAHDWYRELARRVVDWQGRNGVWRHGGRGRAERPDNVVSEYDLVETSYMLLFLSRGRHPVMMNKLRFSGVQGDGAWANRPRDAANLARFASRQLERQLNWQVVDLKSHPSEWLDSPILYLASHEAPRLKETDLEKIKAFVDSGGMLFTHADGGREPFNAFVRDLVKKLWSYELQDVPPDHELWSVVFKIDPRPPLKYVTNGSRVLLVHSPTDIAIHWQGRAERTHRTVFELGVNLFLHAAGKTDLRNRLASPYVQPAGDPAIGSLALARLRYAGNWRPEPLAHQRLARLFQWETGHSLDITTVEIPDLKPDTSPIAHLTGTGAYTLHEAQRRALRAYVDAGGVLLVDACGGDGAFAASMEKQLVELLSDQPPAMLLARHPLLSGAGGAGMEDLSKVQLRQFTTLKLGPHAGRVLLLRSGKGAAILSGLDLTTGLLGTRSWGILGYEPAWAAGFVKNAILWTVYGARDR
jgi:hypothetical protein